MRKITYACAIKEAIDEEMQRDENVFLIGEDVADAGGTWKTSEGLLEKYGEWRVRNAPISETGFSGLAVGAAIYGARPVVEIMFGDFALVCADMIMNQAAKFRYVTGGMVKMPIVFRMPMGAGRSSGVHHSQTLHALFAHIPGLKVVAPSSAAEAKGLLKASIRDEDPVVFIEAKLEYSKKYEVPEDELLLPLGKAHIPIAGEDLTIVASGNASAKCVKAIKALNDKGVYPELVDLRTIMPLDTETILDSVKKTGRLLIVDDGPEGFGITGEIAFHAQNKAFSFLKAPVERLAPPDIPIPFSPALEFPILVDPEKITAKVLSFLKK